MARNKRNKNSFKPELRRKRFVLMHRIASGIDTAEQNRDVRTIKSLRQRYNILRRGYPFAHLRELTGWTSAQAAERFGVSTSRWMRWELINRPWVRAYAFLCEQLLMMHDADHPRIPKTVMSMVRDSLGGLRPLAVGAKPTAEA